MKINLSQNQRIIVAFSYLIILLGLFKIVGGNVSNLAWDTNIDSSIWFYAGAFMIILGAYIVEPFFTKPSDVIANSTAVLIALFGLSNKQNLFGYTFIFYYAVAILSVGIITIILKDVKTDFLRKVSKSLYWFVETFGASKVIFSVVYLSASYSYFAVPEKIIAFISIIAFWICITFFDVIGLIVERVTKLINYLGNKIGDEIGQAIGCENPLLYKVEIDYTKHGGKPAKYGDLVALETSVNVGSVGMVVDTKYLLNKRWLSIYLLQDENSDILKINLKDKKLITEPKSIFAKENLVYFLDIVTLDQNLKTKIENNPLYKDREQFIGYVSSGSNINILNFSIVREANKLEQKISEGAVLKTLIYGQETLYQVINGNAKEEHLENFDRHGFIIGIARKLGKYKKVSKDLDVSKWMPSIFSPLFYAFSGSVSKERIKEIANNSIGRLPDTDLEIPIKDFNAIVTHNTAILGILGIGKSCLTFEVIKKVIAETSAKVICFDITGEYSDELAIYGCNPKILNDSEIQTELTKNYETINKDINKGGNHAQFKQKITDVLKTFLDDENDRLLIINPENYDVSKQTNDIKNKKIGPGPNDWQEQAPMSDLTLVEKTRIISEVILEYSKNKGRTKDAKCLLVFEEAHSLIPEWNSVSSEGDKSATNGTAKVILQGRKYGLGSLVITQRTANVSKSVLNQCNTIFALRVFDDTGKGFLENYIGKDYADTLATLEERHAIAIGKGLKLKQPVIIQLNHMDNIKCKDEENK